jgi:hypothetical protein
MVQFQHNLLYNFVGRVLPPCHAITHENFGNTDSNSVHYTVLSVDRSVHYKFFYRSRFFCVFLNFWEFSQQHVGKSRVQVFQIISLYSVS